jgi:hypothetical protein
MTGGLCGARPRGPQPMFRRPPAQSNSDARNELSSAAFVAFAAGRARRKPGQIADTSSSTRPIPKLFHWQCRGDPARSTCGRQGRGRLATVAPETKTFVATGNAAQDRGSGCHGDRATSIRKPDPAAHGQCRGVNSAGTSTGRSRGQPADNTTVFTGGKGAVTGLTLMKDRCADSRVD